MAAMAEAALAAAPASFALAGFSMGGYVSFEILRRAPQKVKRLALIDTQAVAEHFGLAEGTPAPDTEGYGEVLPDDPARTADQDLMRAGQEPADQQRAKTREGGLEPERETESATPGYLSDRSPGGL